MSKWVRPPITEATLRRRARLAKAQDGICPECKLALPDDLSEAEIDHIIPRVRGGPEDAWNKQLVHFMCNRSKRFKLTPEAEALAKEHGVRLHLPIPASAIAYRPLTLRESRREDMWSELSRMPVGASAEERERFARKYFDYLQESA